MYLSTATYLLVTSFALSQAQSTVASAATPSLAAGSNYWCGSWAGAPNPGDVPSMGQQLPADDQTKRFFVEPQLQRVPFSPVMASEPKEQIPKFWGNNNARVALLSYATKTPATRIYSASKSTWFDFHKALSLLMDQCVSKGSGGAYLVPPSSGLTQGTLVVYVYEIGSEFDFQMNYYMTTPYGIDPSTFGQTSASSAESAIAAIVSVPASDAVDYSAATTLATAAPASSAAIAAAPAGYSYLGCYTETPTRALPADNLTGGTTTVSSCAQFCAAEEYFGVEFGTQCFCANSLGQGSVLVDDGCDMPCAGNSGQICGGVERLSVYQKQTATA